MIRPAVPVAVAALAISALMAHADPAPAASTETSTVAADWVWTAGVVSFDTPKFGGADRRRLVILPTLGTKYRDWFFANPFDGIGLSKSLSKAWTITAAIGPDLNSRRDKDDPRLHGTPNVHISPAAIYTLNYETGPLSIDTTVSERLGRSNQQGTTLDIEASMAVLGDEQGAISLGLTSLWMDKTYARNFFSIDSQSAATSGLAVYDAEGGLKQTGAFIQAYKPFARNWTFLARADVARLHDSAANSPIVRRERQLSTLLTLNRSF